MSNSSVIDDLLGIVGEENVFTESGLRGLGFSRPIIVAGPGSVEQVVEIMKLAKSESLAVIPRGSGTKIGLGRNPERADIILSTKNLSRIIEHAASDLTATAESGVTLGALNGALGRENQFVPIDCPSRDSSTLGGVIAANASGSLRLRYGTAREMLIGLKVVKSDGTVFKGGSKVVKNVAGYDLPKLFVGSLGTLGIITEATFRLYPAPEFSQTCITSFVSAESCAAAAASLLKSDLVLSSLDRIDANLMKWVSGNAGLNLQNGACYLAVRVMNVEKAVKAQITGVSGICSESGGDCRVIDGEAERSLWDSLREFTLNIGGENAAVCRAGVLMTDVGRVFREIEHVSKIHPVTTFASARAGNGIVKILLDGDDEPLGEAISYLRGFCSTAGGYLLVESAPESVRSVIDVWGGMGTGTALMKRIKESFDPDNILNPGRLV